MDCREFALFAMDYVEGKLSPDVRPAVERHVAECESCRQDVKTIASMLEALDADAPAIPSERMRRHLRQDAELRLKARRPYRLTNWALASAAALVVAAIGIGTFSTRQLSSPRDVSGTTPVDSTMSGVRNPAPVQIVSQESVHDRFRRVTECAQQRPDRSTCDQVLLNAVVHDENANVRIAAAEGLSVAAPSGEAMNALATMLQTELSPVVQAAVVDVVARTSGAQARAILREVAANTRYDATIRRHAESALTGGGS